MRKVVSAGSVSPVRCAKREQRAHNINWVLMHGPKRYGYNEQAEQLRNTIVSLCKEQGFYEYYDPTTGFGHGSDLFSWTAALFLDVVFEDRTW